MEASENSHLRMDIHGRYGEAFLTNEESHALYAPGHTPFLHGRGLSTSLYISASVWFLDHVSAR